MTIVELASYDRASLLLHGAAAEHGVAVDVLPLSRYEASWNRVVLGVDNRCARLAHAARLFRNKAAGS
jgi:hypothetical protein